MTRHWFYDESGEQRHESEAIDTDDAAMFAADRRAADQLATLLAVPRAPEAPDHRSAEQIDHDSALEQIAEDRAAYKRGDYDSDRVKAWLAERCERSWTR